MALEYFLLRSNGEQTGTYSIEQVKTMLSTGFIDPDTQYWHEGAAEWLPVERIDESLKFVEANPPAAKTGPPPRRQPSGSLARAIPSPHQKAAVTVSKSGVELHVPSEKKAAGETLPQAPVIPAPAVQREFPPEPEAPLEEEHEIPPYEPPQFHALEPIAVRKPPFRKYIVYAVVLLVLVIVCGIGFSTLRPRSGPPLGRVTLSGKIFVVTDLPSIKTFEDDMRSSPVADALKQQIQQINDPVAQQKLDIGLEKENARHIDEITQQYIKSSKAQFIDGGTYDAIACFDDNGALTLPGDAQPWIAIVYNGNIVYAYRGTDFTLAPQ